MTLSVPIINFIFYFILKVPKGVPPCRVGNPSPRRRRGRQRDSRHLVSGSLNPVPGFSVGTLRCPGTALCRFAGPSLPRLGPASVTRSRSFVPIKSSIGVSVPFLLSRLNPALVSRARVGTGSATKERQRTRPVTQNPASVSRKSRSRDGTFEFLHGTTAK